jgi:hypothetical protein
MTYQWQHIGYRLARSGNQIVVEAFHEYDDGTPVVRQPEDSQDVEDTLP